MTNPNPSDLARALGSIRAEHDSVSRLDWLSALISHYEEIMPGEDPEAEHTALAESRSLLADLRAAAETETRR